MANLSMNRMERGRHETTYDIKRKWRQMMEDRFACAWPHADRWFSVDNIPAYRGIKRDTVQDLEGGQSSRGKGKSLITRNFEGS
jgi:hypothetical protein